MNYISQETRFQFGGVILLAPFKSIIQLTTKKKFLSAFDFYKNDKIIENLDAPLCIIHGTRDKIIPIEHSNFLAKKMNNKYRNLFYPIEQANHYSILILSKSWEVMKKFIYES